MKKVLFLACAVLAFSCANANSDVKKFNALFQKHSPAIRTLASQASSNEVELITVLNLLRKKYEDAYESGNRMKMFEIQRQIDRVNKVYDACEIISGGLDMLELSGLFIASSPDSRSGDAPIQLFLAKNTQYMAMLRQRLADYKTADRSVVNKDITKVMDQTVSQARQYIRIAESLQSALER